MQFAKIARLVLALSAALPLVACATQESRSAFADVHELVAVLTPTAGNAAHGTVTFTAVDGGVKVDFDVSGLTPSGTHAVHVHEFGDLRSEDGTSLGGHYNPEQHEHGLPSVAMRHAGDLGNLVADATGHALVSRVVENITLAGATNPIVGRGVVVHAKPDDGGQPTGNAGGRIAVGVIGVAKP